MSIIFDPENWLVSAVRTLKAYVVNDLNSSVYEIVMSYPEADEIAKKMPLSKTLIHFELDDVSSMMVGMGDNLFNADWNEIDIEITEHEARNHILMFDIGIWSSFESGGPIGRLQARQALDTIFHGASAQRRCFSFTQGLNILEFSGGRFVQDSINDVRVFRVVDLSLRIQLFSKKTLAPIPYIDDITQSPGVWIDDELNVIVDP